MKLNVFKTLVSLTLVFALLVGLASCGSTASISGGLTDESYVVLTAKKEYVGQTVYLSIDGAEAVPVRLTRDDNKARKASRITVQPGRHQVSITDQARKQLYRQEIFVSTRNSKLIALP